MAKFLFSRNYEKALARIEDYIFESTDSIDAVSLFLKAHDEALLFIVENPSAAATHLLTGEQSWLFADGRYRMFFRTVRKNQVLIVYLIHLIDNKQANLKIYPAHKIPTYDEE